MHHLTLATEFKALSEDGTFEGYASTFNNVDQGGDVILPGAFKAFVFTKDGQVRILNQHNRHDPIGKGRVWQDDKGLRFKGRLTMEAPSARGVHALMRDGVIDSTSIGFDVLPGGAKVRSDGVRELSGLKLWEFSPVTFAMNDQAEILSVKEAPTTVRELEALLREWGFSNSKARAIALKGFPAQDSAPAEDPIQTLRFALQRAALKFNIS